MTVTRCARVLLCLNAVLAVAACSNNSNRAVTATVGVDTGVALTTAGSVTSLLEAETLALGASVENPSTSDGVTWSLTGVGSLSAQTGTTATYNAPSTVTGAATALITATSIDNPTQLASVALIVLGSPQIDPLTLFPGNVDVAYQSAVSAAGGDSPFTWIVQSGALPPGLSLSGSTSSATYIQGTPTATGTYTFTLQTTDTLSRAATVALSLTIYPEAACVLSGTYTFVASGYRGGDQYTHTGVIQISSTGVVTGEQDYKDPHRTTAAETLISGGTCVNRETNTGVLTLEAPSGELVYNFAATPPDSNGIIQSAGIQLIHSGADSGIGHMSRQDPTALTGAAPVGNFAFGLLGVDAGETHFGMAGRFTSTAGVLSAGLIDSNDTTPLVAAPLTGTLSAMDANGRGTLTMVTGADSSTFAYYLVNASKMFMINIDPTPNATTATTRVSGQMTAQVGDVGVISFDNTALASPSVLSLLGVQGNVEPVGAMALGRLSNADPAAGTVDLILDSSINDTNVGGELYTAQTYSVADNGRGTLSLGSLSSTIGARSLAFYLDGTADGYIVEHTTGSRSAGLLEAQFQGPYAHPPPTGIFPATLTNAFVSTTAYPQSHGPISLEPLIYLNYDALSSSYLNGSFAIDPGSGRGLGNMTENGVGTTSAAIYIVSPQKVDILRFGARALDSTIEFMTQH